MTALERAAAAVPSPCYLVDIEKLESNARVLGGVRESTGCGVLLALKGFAMHGVFPLLRDHFSGACASSVHETRLAREEFGGEVHVHGPAFSREDIREMGPLMNHITFNSLSQWESFSPWLKERHPDVRLGLRINPEHSEVETAIYDPCAPGSRLGVRTADLPAAVPKGMSGLHFHTLCEKDSYALARTLEAVERRFGGWLRSEAIAWVNFGGGHHVTRPDYNAGHLCGLIGDFAGRYGVRVYLEPGEAAALNSGYLVATVLDIAPGPDMPSAILDTSATAHMPDVLEMPYRPRIIGAGELEEGAQAYRLGGNSCLAGDVIGVYSFADPLEVGKRVVFEDMAHYTMVKNTTFNGVRLPAIATFDPRSGETVVLREFGYASYRDRLS
ncbi:MAG TPA: carboxynorspermidine decarboxylase [Verrucomicrobiales bacterium]|nr:carboxynorspermidine decarboxylase [Verrucomicrobiales bacterium]